MTARDADLVVSEAQSALDSFLVDNAELEALNARLARFNLFDVLRVTHVEIRHSNVLAWLLSPDQSHGLGSLFLRRFLSRLLMDHSVEGVKLSASQVELMPFGDIEVYRERQNVDVMVQSRSGRWCLIIETKIRSKESRGQLSRYRRAIAEEMPDAQIIPVYLTLDGDEPSDDGRLAGFVPLGFSTVLELAERVIEQNITRIPSDAQVFLRQYVDTLRRLTMQDTELIELCKAIYRRHRDAIDLIVQYGVASEVMDVAESVLTDLAKPEFMHHMGRSLWFIPGEAAKLLPRIELSHWGFLPRPTPICCWLGTGPNFGKLWLRMEVGPIADAALRIVLLKRLADAGFKYWKGGLEEGAKFTRILTVSQTLRKDDEGEPDQSAEYLQKVIESLWEKFWQEGQAIIPVLKTFEWGGKAKRAR